MASDEDEAAIEQAWLVSGSLDIIALRLFECTQRNEPPPSWTWKALRDLAAASRPEGDKRYAQSARRLVRYVAVREAHDHEGLSWSKAAERAAEMLRGWPAEAEAETMWKDYKEVRKALRAAGVPDDDPGYRWIDLPDKKPG